jgi:uncharacterized protein YodC (DUF2158 family)
MSKFSVGDIVQLKGGGPQMTVVGIGKYGWDTQDQMLCKWFKNQGELADELFPPEAVVLVTENK